MSRSIPLPKKTVGVKCKEQEVREGKNNPTLRKEIRFSSFPPSRRTVGIRSKKLEVGECKMSPAYGKRIMTCLKALM